MCIHEMRVTIDVILLKERPLSDGTSPIVVRLTQNRKRKYIRIGISLDQKHWDDTKNRPKLSCPNKEYIDNIITETLAKYQKLLLEFQIDGKEISINQILVALNSATKKVGVKEFLDKVISDLKKEGRVGNACHYEALLNSLQSFTKIKQLQFVDIDAAFLNRYEAYLVDRGNKGNTISIKMRTFKALFNNALKCKIVKEEYYPFGEYKVSKLKEETLKRAISKVEILQIVDFNVTSISNRPQSLLQFSKDLFLFSYLGCGINLVDMAYLKISDISSNSVTYKRHKTGKLITFILQPLAKEIILRYIDKNGVYLFPILNDDVHISPEQKFRRIKKVTYVVDKNLKKIGVVIGLSLPLTTYVARHSFATVLKRSGVNVSIISEALGHSDLKTTQIYLDSFEDDQMDKAMKNLL